MQTGPAEMGLTEAAHELGVRYQVAWNFALSGELEARKEEGKWVVTRNSVEQLRARRAGEPLRAVV